MIYFDNAATSGFRPDRVVSSACATLNNNANPGRSGHKLALACLERVQACRALLCEFFGGYSSERVIFTKNCTEALNIALLGSFIEGDRVVTTVAEHNSVLRPLHALKRRGVNVVYVPYDENCIIANVTPKTKAVVVSLASNVTGDDIDVATIRRNIPPNVLLVCDGAQACGHVELDMKKLGIDALAVAGHKGMLGIQGSGALVLSERLSPAPITFGGTGSDSNNPDMPDFYPDKLESGTLSYPAIISLGEGALYLKEHAQENRQKLFSLTSELWQGLKNIKGVRVFSRPNPYGIVAFELDNMQSEMTAYRLSEDYSICVRGGLHCAPLMHKSLSSDGLVRASLSAFNAQSEVQSFLGAVEKLAEE